MYNYLELRKEELKKRGNKGFTLMEMLIVVAIIAVLIAIAIPVFTSQLEKSRDTTSAANIRSAYAEAQAAYLSQDTGGNSNIEFTYDSADTAQLNITGVKVKNVQFQGSQAGWSGAISNLPNDVDWATALGADDTGEKGGQPGEYTLTFTYPTTTGAKIALTAEKQA